VAASHLAPASGPKPVIPEKLDPAKLKATLAAGKPPVTISAKRSAMMAQIKAEAGKHPKDPGWKFIASCTVEQIATIVGSHVENMAGACKKLSEGGAKPDQKKS
jgi:hypothetical protein